MSFKIFKILTRCITSIITDLYGDGAIKLLLVKKKTKARTKEEKNPYFFLMLKPLTLGVQENTLQLHIGLLTQRDSQDSNTKGCSWEESGKSKQALMHTMKNTRI